MLNDFFNRLSSLSPLFYQILYMSIAGSIAGIVVCIIRNIFDKKIYNKMKCTMWLIVLTILLVPVQFEIPVKELPKQNAEIISTFEEIKHIGNNIAVNNEADAQTVLNTNTNNTLRTDKNTTSLRQLSYKNLICNSVLPLIWLIGIIISLLIYFSASIKLKKRIVKAYYKNDRIEKILKECQTQLNIKKDIKLALLDDKTVPGIYGLFNPVILLSKGSLAESDDAIRYIFLHELSHYKRKDALFNYLLIAAVAVHWFNPIIWILFKTVRQDIEFAADELAIKKLNQNEIKAYAMVLISSLKVIDHKANTSSMLCISDTEKNMKRRIKMLKGKQKSIIVSLIVIVIILIAVLCTVFLKSTNSDNPSIKLPETTLTDTSLQDNEKVAIENYVNLVCNTNLNNRLPEFDNINKADKAWIYSHINRDNDKSYMTENEITEDLQGTFGNELVLDVLNDTKSDDNIAMPQFDSDKNSYELPAFGMDNSTCYEIHSISKSGDTYKVNIIEYNIRDDFDTEEAVISTYDESINDYWKWKEIFRISGASNEEIVKQIFEKKDQFTSFEITLKKNTDGSFSIIKSEKIK